MIIMMISRALIFSSICLCFVSCEAAQDSAGKAFDNAGSVIRSGEKKLYMPADGSSSSSTPSSNQEDNDYRRY